MSELLQFDESGGAEQSATVSLGDTFRISLKENPTTGYRWKVAVAGEPVCALLDDEFRPGVAPGAGGIHHWRFRAAAAGETRVEMRLQRSWTPEAARQFKLAVRVKR